MKPLSVPLIRNECIAADTYLLRVIAPEIAAAAVPGQFAMLRLTGRDAPLIGRAFAFYDLHAGQEGAVDLVYLRKGSLTRPLSDAPLGTHVTLWGPLGNGFPNQECDELLIAVGGIGQTPMLTLGREALGQASYGHVNVDASNRTPTARQNGWAKHVSMVYGARTAERLAGLEDFRGAGIEMHLCTDDGSAGTPQRVPDRLSDLLDEKLRRVTNDRIRVVTCGPEIMMQKVVESCQERGVKCEVSMETPMACGIGICYSCVAKVHQPDGHWDYRRTCVEGPIFDGQEICWA
ncbi:MAG: dihydroorotate dehydrogenase electron transfer subunit [Planctomycetota bacterium]